MPPAPPRAALTGSTPRSPAEARALPPPKTPPMRRPSPRRSRSAPRDTPQTEALIARISELTSVVTQLVAERDQASWNHRVEAHGLSVELLDAMWYAAAVDHQTGYKQKCLRWIGPYFPGTTAEERKVQTVEQNNMSSNVKVAVLGPDYIALCLQEESSDRKTIRRSWASPSIRCEGWSVSIYDYSDRSWTVEGTPVVMSWDTIMSTQVGSWSMLPRRKLRHHLPKSLVILETPRMEMVVGTPLAMIRRKKRTMTLKRSLKRTARALFLMQRWKQRRTKNPMDVVEEIPIAHAAVTAP